MVPSRTPNRLLRALLHESGWSGQKLANAVNAAAAENGVKLSYDRTSVFHWLAGSRPPPTVVAMVAEVLSRQLARPIQDSDTGLTGSHRHHDQGIPGEETQVVEQLVRLGNAGSPRRSVLRAVIYTLTSLNVPSLGAAATALPPPAGERERIGTAHADAAELILTVFSDNDNTFGGGKALPALTAYLATDVASWLRAPASPTARARLCAAAAKLSYLAGWMCFDELLQGAAQRYYRAAATLAATAGNLDCYTAAVRAQSVQAYHLGHYHRARDLAEAALRDAHGLSSKHVAFVMGQAALAHASCGDHRQALAELATTERLLEKDTDTAAAVGAYHLAALEYHRAEVLSHCGDRHQAIAALRSSLCHRPPTERRARAVSTARLAELYLDIGHVEFACVALSQVLDDRFHLSCTRVERTIASLRARLRPCARTPRIRTLLTRASPQSLVSA
nr:putative transcriptional regulator [Kibdelosporangium sp. MJ126-NF4]CTQ99158.1 putative transcriptional regulator [Kibdelosporangium sp. MJ126-NF4]